MPDRLMLLDTASLYFRAFYGVPDSIKSPDGQPVNAVRGLLDFIGRLVTDYSPTRMVACMDADWRPAFRVVALPSYKAHRVGSDGIAESVPEALIPQVPVIEQVLDAIGIARIGVPGFEADDVIGTLAATADCPTDVVTGDRDLFQVVDDGRQVRVLYTARGVGRLEIIDEGVVAGRYGIPGDAYADFAILRGDPSDGLPGVPGVGDKTAATLISRFGHIEGLVEALDDPAADISPTLRRKIKDAEEYVTAAIPVVRVRTDVPLPDYDDALPKEPADPAALTAMDERWGLRGSLSRALDALAATASAHATSAD